MGNVEERNARARGLGERQNREYAKTLRQYDWQWCGTLIVASDPLTSRHADIKFINWVEELRKEDGGPAFRWVRVITGDDGEPQKVHFLIGGLCNRRTKWARRWDKLQRNAEVLQCDPHGEDVRRFIDDLAYYEGLDMKVALP